LYLPRNQIGDLGPLSELAHLVTLNVSDNRIEDIGPLANLEDLSLAVVERNKVKELTPLVRAVSGGGKRVLLRLYLAGNPLSEAARDELRAAGVRVES
jgi:Leucine-rich repeat (LRR) protein